MTGGDRVLAQLLGNADAHMLIVLLLLMAAVVAIAERVNRGRKP